METINVVIIYFGLVRRIQITLFTLSVLADILNSKSKESFESFASLKINKNDYIIKYDDSNNRFIVQQGWCILDIYPATRTITEQELFTTFFKRNLPSKEFAIIGALC